MINRLLVAAAVAAAATVAGVGVWLGASGTISLVGDRAGAEAPVLPTSSGTVSYVACPGEQPIGELRSGDRVFLTGRDASGEWVEVRAPEDVAIPVWVRAEVVDPDGDADLPEVDCELTEAALGATTTTTAPDEESVPDETTTTTVAEDEEPGDGEPTPTTAPTTAPPVTTPTSQPGPPPPTSTTQPPPPPVIGTINRSHTEIYEADPPGSCYSALNAPVSALVSAAIPNATSATLSWSIDGQPGSTSMQRSGSTFSARFGEFGPSTVNSTVTVTVTVTATGPGGTDTRSTSIRLHNCGLI